MAVQPLHRALESSMLGALLVRGRTCRQDWPPVQAYLANTEARSNAFKSLTKSDASAARVIEQRMRKLVHMQVSPPGWSPSRAQPMHSVQARSVQSLCC